MDMKFVVFNGCWSGWRYCGDMWWNLVGVVVFVVAIFGGGIWEAAFWVGNGGVGFGRCGSG